MFTVSVKEKLPVVIETVKDRLISLHISDNDGQEERHWLPGEGVIDFWSYRTRSVRLTLTAMWCWK